LAGITAVEAADRLTWPRVTRAGVAVVVIMATLSAGALAEPYAPNGVEQDSYWFTVERVQAYGDDVERLTKPGEQVFTAQPLYVIEADRRIAGDLSRKYYLYRGWPNRAVTDRVTDEIVRSIDDEETTLAVLDSESAVVMNESERINQTVRSKFCPVKNDTEFWKTGGTLLVRCQIG
jgi:hypothetical protein